ncbi:MAG: hypothetical protein WC548_03775 [Candidatus Pacearchaeota archaeon]
MLWVATLLPYSFSPVRTRISKESSIIWDFLGRLTYSGRRRQIVKKFINKYSEILEDFSKDQEVIDKLNGVRLMVTIALLVKMQKIVLNK